MHCAGSAGNSPESCQALLVAVVGAPSLLETALREEMGLDFGIILLLGDAPCGASVGDERVGEKNDGSHVLHGDACRLEGHLEAVGRADCREDAERRLAVAAEEGLKQVGLLCFGGKTRRGTSALHVDHHERELGHHGQADTFRLQCETGTGSRGHREVSGIACADGGAYSGDFILHLDSLHTEVLALCQLMENIGCGSYGIASEEEGPAALLGGHDETPCGGGVAGDVGIYARLGRRCVDTVDGERAMCVVAIVPTGLEHKLVGLVHGRLLGEFGL